jgi:EAL domain-containing protein (putative c-di-GMP-specific phosphodiesterase class I)
VVVAEGIEDAATAAVLTEMGCDLGQGYYFARPVPPQEFAAKVAILACHSAPAAAPATCARL